MNAFAVERQVTNRAAVNPLMRRRVLNVQAFVLAVGRQVKEGRRKPTHATSGVECSSVCPRRGTSGQ